MKETDFDNDKVSIIIATYNAEKLLSNALESVISQTYDNFECIIIDAVSTDSTIKIIEQFKTKDRRIRYISEPDNGIYNAYNKGWKLAKGKWIYYLGSDDTLLNESISIFSKHFEQADLIYGNFTGLYSSGKIYNGVSKPIKKTPYIMPASHQAMIMKKEIINSCNGFDESFKSKADHNLVTKAYFNGYSFKRISDTLAQVNLEGFSGQRSDIISQSYRNYKKGGIVKFPLITAIYYGSRWYFSKRILDSIRKIVNVG